MRQGRTLMLVGVAAATAALAVRPRRPAIREAQARPHRVVIAGAGFGGLQAALELAGRPGIDLCLIDQHNHHLFQPLLYQVATAALGPDDIAAPVRDALPPGTQVRLARVLGLDTDARNVLWDGLPIPYDTLILATGSQPSFIGHPEWQNAAPGLKTLGDALNLRRQIITAFERAASAPPGSSKRSCALTFVLIGGGTTGVEMAGSIAELAHQTLSHDFAGDPSLRARIILIEASRNLLPDFPRDLAWRAESDLAALGVELRLGTPVEEIEPGRVHVGGKVIEAETVIWTAGVEATPVAQWLGIRPARGGQVKVQPDLTVPGHPDIYVIGDAALCLDRNGQPLPGLAPVAKQQGRYVAGAIRRALRGRRTTWPFRYWDYGTLATIGRDRAVADFRGLHLTGFPAWIAWAGAHIFFLISFRNRVLVGTQWFISYIMRHRGGRVLTETF